MTHGCRTFEVAAIKTDRRGTAIVDAEDYPRVRRQRWYYAESGPYRQVPLDHPYFPSYKSPQSLMRFVAQTSDHVGPINGDWWDCRRVNIGTRRPWRPHHIREMESALHRVRSTLYQMQRGK